MRTGPRFTGDRLGLGGDSSHPILNLLLERRASGSLRGQRTDGRTVALAIEGGGAAGSVSGGMCLWLESAGLIDAVDLIYGTSTGALNGCYTAAGQGVLGSTNYEDVATRGFSNPGRVLLRKPIIDLDLLFHDVCRVRKPLSPEGIASGPSLHIVGVDLDAAAIVVLDEFKDVEELLEAVRASCAVPLLSGPPIVFRGMRVSDGGLLESIPHRSALAGGATDVLVLRSRPATYRKSKYSRLILEVVKRAAEPALARLVAARPALYNAEASELAQATTLSPFLQIAPHPQTALVPQLAKSPAVVRRGLIAGAAAAAAAFRVGPPVVHWQPTIYDQASTLDQQTPGPGAAPR